jgi:hypothetical protein
MRATFDRDHYVILPKLFEPALLDELTQRVESSRFVPRGHKDVGLEFCMDDEITAAALLFFPNSPSFLRLIEQITGNPRLGEFKGRVYRMTSSDGHYDLWHDDCVRQRVATMSVNLSREAYAGGALQMRYHDSNEILHEVHNTGFGDALLFRISENLTHRVQGVVGEVPKTAFAGWFLEGNDLLPDFWERIREASDDE